MIETVYFVGDEAQTQALALRLSNQITAPAILYFSGPLGAGKTTFIRALLRAWGVIGPIKSPSYAIIEPYETIRGPVYHFDLYRLASVDELLFLGWRDYLAQKGILFIEWPEKGGDELPTPDFLIELAWHEKGREIKITQKKV